MVRGRGSRRRGRGSALAAAGDPDGDGASALAVGAPLSDREETDGVVVYVFDVFDGGDAWSGAQDIDDARDARITGEDRDGWFGAAVAVGDLDGDSVGDLLVGAPGESDARGRVYVFGADTQWYDDQIDAGDADSAIEDDDDDDALGSAVLAADLDGDGIDQAVLCAPGWDLGSHDDVGACFVVAGEYLFDADGDPVVDVDSANIIGDTSGDRLGDNPNALAAGDLDGDGISDLALGMPGYDGGVSDGGGVVVVFGGALSGRTQPDAADLLLAGDGGLGTAVSIPGDLDGDGLLSQGLRRAAPGPRRLSSLNDHDGRKFDSVEKIVVAAGLGAGDQGRCTSPLTRSCCG